MAKIENYFVSDEFLNIISSFKNKIKFSDSDTTIDLVEYLISCGIEYSILLSDDDLTFNNITDFLTKVANYIIEHDTTIKLFERDSSLDSYIRSLYVEALLNKVNLPKESLENHHVRMKFYKYMTEKVLLPSFKFHAFNSTFYESIKRNGISPYIQFTPQEDIDKINEIFIRHGIEGIFGYQKLNCEGKISYSQKPSVSYYYAINSPEWFSQFTGQAFPYHPLNKYQKNSYVTNDYLAAKENLIAIMDDYNFTLQEENKVLEFFEENWKKYSQKTPMLAIIPFKEYKTPIIEKTCSYLKKSTECQENILSAIGYITSNATNCFQSILLDNNIDCQTTKIIDVKETTFLRLPKYNDIYNLLTESKTLKKSIH